MNAPFIISDQTHNNRTTPDPNRTIIELFSEVRKIRIDLDQMSDKLIKAQGDLYLGNIVDKIQYARNWFKEIRSFFSLKDNPISVAIATYEAIKALKESMEGKELPSWEQAKDADKHTILRSVDIYIHNPELDPEEGHNKRVGTMRMQGWSWGPIADIQAKCDPRIKDYSEMDEMFKKINLVTINTVRSFINDTPDTWEESALFIPVNNLKAAAASVLNALNNKVSDTKRLMMRIYPGRYEEAFMKISMAHAYTYLKESMFEVERLINHLHNKENGTSENSTESPVQSAPGN